MSILNDALRKRNTELNGGEKGISSSEKQESHNSNKIIIWGGAGLIFVLMVVLGGIYSWSYLQMQFFSGKPKGEKSFTHTVNTNSGQTALAQVVPPPSVKDGTLSVDQNAPSNQGTDSGQIHSSEDRKAKRKSEFVRITVKEDVNEQKSSVPPASRDISPKSNVQKKHPSAQPNSVVGGNTLPIREGDENIQTPTHTPNQPITEQHADVGRMDEQGEDDFPVVEKLSLEEEESQNSKKKDVQEESGSDNIRRTEEPFFGKALSYHRAGRTGSAIEMYRQVLKKDPGHRDTIFNLASAYIEFSRFAEAHSLLMRLMDTPPANSHVLLNLAISEIGLGRPEKAFDHLEKAESLKGPEFEINLNRGIAYSQIGRTEDAIEWYKRAEEIRQDEPTLFFNMAVCYDRSQRYEDALTYYQKFVALKPTPSKQLRSVKRRINGLRAYLSSQTYNEDL